MADYLARIVARNTGVARPVRPRVASLFEPVGFAVAATAVAPLPARRDVASRVDEPREPDLTPDGKAAEPPRVDAARASPSPPPRPTIADEAPATRPVERVVPVEHPGRAPAARLPTSGTNPPPRPAAPPSSPVPGRPPSQERTEVAAAPSGPPASRPDERPAATAPQPGDDVQRRLQTIADAVLALQQASTAPTLGSGSSHDSRGAVEASPLRPRVSPAPETNVARRSNRAPSPASGERLVHVTIGRVDVRAPAGPAQPDPAHARREPPTRLNEYLGRRNGTRR